MKEENLKKNRNETLKKKVNPKQKKISQFHNTEKKRNEEVLLTCEIIDLPRPGPRRVGRLDLRLLGHDLADGSAQLRQARRVQGAQGLAASCVVFTRAAGGRRRRRRALHRENILWVVCRCGYSHMHGYTHARARAYAYTRINIHAACTYTHIRIHTTCIYTHTHAHSMYIHTYTHARTHTHASVHIHMRRITHTVIHTLHVEKHGPRHEYPFLKIYFRKQLKL